MQLFNRVLQVCLTLIFLFIPLITQANSGNTLGVKIEKLLETEKSWDGAVYRAYPAGIPQLSVLKITLAPHTRLTWHKHPIPNAAYLLSGSLTVEKKSSGEKRLLKAGEVLPEIVDSVHRGYTEKNSAVLLVFYAGQKGLPLSIPVK